MASWDSSDCLALFNQMAGRPTADAITDAQKYAMLSKAQNRVIAMMAPVVPNSLYPKVSYGSLPTLTTTDSQVYTFGTDAQGYAQFPMGQGGIFASLNDIPTNPLRPGADYMIEGTQIRALNNTTLPATLYWYGIGQPADMTALVQPALFPESSRDLIVIEAVRRFAQSYVRNLALKDEMELEWAKAWPLWCHTWKTAFKQGGALRLTGQSMALASGNNAFWGG